MTYPEQMVSGTIGERFVPVQINTQEEWGKPVVERFRQAWTPDLRVLGSDAFEYYGWNGYLPPYEFVPQLLVGQGRALLRMDDLPGAAEVFKDVVRRFPTSAVAAEAQYYYAVSRYKASHEANDLWGAKGWRALQTRYPASIWRIKQSFGEDK